MPLNIKVMNVDNFIKHYGFKEVKSLGLFTPSDTSFDEEGLFSEDIFGIIGSPERMSRFGYISLSIGIIPPIIYKHLLTLSKFYINILNGSERAIFDKTEKNFVKSEEGETGYSFFMSRYKDIVFKETGSLERKNKIKLLDDYRDVLYERYLVMPAGLREIEEDAGPILAQDDINRLYQSLLSLSFSMVDGADSDIFDVVKFKIQQKTFEIFEYIENILSNKQGFLQGGGYGSRNISLGTRNVLTSATYDMKTPDDIQAMKPNETLVGIFQTVKGLQPIVIYYFRNIFFDTILTDSESDRIPLTDKNFKLSYVEITPLERERYTSNDGLEKVINRFRNKDVRKLPVTIKGTDNKDYYLLLVYDEGHRITIIRSLSDAKERLPDFNPSFLRPITWAEVFYIAAFYASRNRYCVVARYPVIEDGSSYPSAIGLRSTMPSREISLRNWITDTEIVKMPSYPDLSDESVFLDTVVVHTSSLIGLGGDYDGDMVSVNFLMSDQTTDEIREYFEKTRSFLTPEKKMLLGEGSDLVKLVLINLSLDP